MRGLSIRLTLVSLAILPVGATCQASPIIWSIGNGGNGHYYDVIASGYLTWFDSKSAAENSSFMGLNGHLATIASQAESDFVLASFGGDNLRSKWLGGFRTSITPTPSEGWAWITGEPWVYTNWAVGEPNNANINETALQYHFDAARESAWNDLMPTGDDRSNGYVIEYEASAVPEPSTLLSATLGLFTLAGYAGWRRVRPRRV